MRIPGKAHKIYILLAFFLLNFGALGQLSGTFTIDKNGTGSNNFISFGAAVSALTTSGVSGPTVFHVKQGSYNERFSIPSITGNKTESAVSLTHLPTGIVVECQDGRSQHKNYEQALKVLRSRMFDMEFKKKQAEQAAKRKTMVSTGDRSAKIRTYNYPQGRVTDHRIGLTTYNLNDVVGGEIQRFIDELHMAENAEKMKEGTDII